MQCTLLVKNQILVLHREFQRRQDLPLRINATGMTFLDAVDGKRRQAGLSGEFRCFSEKLLLFAISTYLCY